jgi:hypothetical protein
LSPADVFEEAPGQEEDRDHDRELCRPHQPAIPWSPASDQRLRPTERLRVWIRHLPITLSRTRKSVKFPRS